MADDQVPEPTVLMTGIAFGESPRWHDGRLWFTDWAAQEVIALGLDGSHEVVLEIASFPFCIDFLPDGRLLVVSAADQRVFRREPDGALVTHADLAATGEAFPWNDIAVDGRGNAYVNNIGYDFGGDDPGLGTIYLVTPDGAVSRVAEGLSFPNGMVVTPDGATLIVGESHANRLTAFDVADDGTLANRRVWADVGDDAPDGICLDVAGAVWYGDVGHGHCRRVAEGGEILQTIEFDRGCFACALGGPGGTTLFMVGQAWDPTSMGDDERTGQVVAIEVGIPGVDRP